MNKQQKINRLISSIKPSSRKEGYCKYYPNNTDLHEDTKWEILKILKKRKWKVFTECVVGTNRFDLATISPEGMGFVIEIIKSEKQASINRKLNEYDLLWNFVSIDVKEFDKETFEL